MGLWQGRDKNHAPESYYELSVKSDAYNKLKRYNEQPEVEVICSRPAEPNEIKSGKRRRA